MEKFCYNKRRGDRMQFQKTIVRVAITSGIIFLAGTAIKKVTVSRQSATEIFAMDTPTVKPQEVFESMTVERPVVIDPLIPTETLEFKRSDGTIGYIIVVDERVETKEQERIASIQAIFQRYCPVYQINEELAYETARTITNNFTDPMWLERYNIEGTTYHHADQSYPNAVMGINAFLRHLYQIPETFGYTKEQVCQSSNFSIEGSLVDKIRFYCNDFDFPIPANVVVSIFNAESSLSFQVQNAEIYNLSGQIDGKGSFASYQTIEQNICETLLNIYYRHLEPLKQDPNFQVPIQKEMSLDAVEVLVENLQKTYAPINAENDPNHLNDFWKDNVLGTYKQLLQDSHSYDDRDKSRSMN